MNKTVLTIIIYIFSLLLLSIVGFYAYKYGNILSDLNALSKFFSGVMNPIFAFCSLLFLIVILKLQREKIKAQITTTENIRFENTFYALLEQHNAMLSASHGENLDKFIHALLLVSENCDDVKKQLQKGKIAEKYKHLLPEDNTDISIVGIPVNQYFLVLYQLLILIASSCPNSTMKGRKFSLKNIRQTQCSPEESFYTNIIRAFLTNEICYLLMFNCYYNNENDTLFKFKLLIERYSLFEQLDHELEGLPDYIPDNRLLKQFKNKFEKLAFAARE